MPQMKDPSRQLDQFYTDRNLAARLVALARPEYVAVWKKLEPQPKVDEVIRGSWTTVTAVRPRAKPGGA